MGSFHVIHDEVAVQLNNSVTNALILESIGQWVKHNEENGKHIYDGHVWTYNSIEAFCKQFPFFSKSTITRALVKLEADGYILTGNYNKLKYDRTKWYALTEKAVRLLGFAISEQVAADEESQNDQMQDGKMNCSILPKCTNESCQNDQIDSPKMNEPIPKNNQCIKHNIPPNPQGDKWDIIFEEFYKQYPRHEGKDRARKAFKKLKPDESLLSQMLAALEKHKKSAQWTKDNGQFIPHPATWINQRRWEDELPEEKNEKENPAPSQQPRKEITYGTKEYYEHEERRKKEVAEARKRIEERHRREREDRESGRHSSGGIASVSLYRKAREDSRNQELGTS